MAQGTVKYYYTDKGYGSIAVDGGRDAFVSYKSIQDAGSPPSLETGQRVEFDLQQGTKGNEAINVRIIV
jgi:CspA family cold shock protein